MSLILIGNIIALIGSILMICNGLIKERTNILKAQCAQFSVNCISNLILGGITGAISNLLNVARNLYCLKREITLIPGLAFVGIQSLITISVNREGLIGWLPVLATLSYTAFINEKDEIKLKIVIIFGLVCWGIYDLTRSNYVACVSDVFSVFSNIWGIGSILRDRKRDE